MKLDRSREGDSIWKVIRGYVPRSWPHFFRPVGASYSLPIYHQCTAHVPTPPHPPFSIFRKKNAFSALFWQKFQLSRCKFAQILTPKTPQFSMKIRSLDPIGNPFDTHTNQKKIKKKKVECPSPSGERTWAHLFGISLWLERNLSS